MNKLLSPDCYDLLIKLLKKDPQERYSAIQALNHPWFIKIKASSPSSFPKKHLLQSQSSIDD